MSFLSSVPWGALCMPEGEAHSKPGSVCSPNIRVTFLTATSTWGMMELANRLFSPNTHFQLHVSLLNTLSWARLGERKALEVFKSQWNAESYVFRSHLRGDGRRLTMNRNGAFLSLISTQHREASHVGYWKCCCSLAVPRIRRPYSTLQYLCFSPYQCQRPSPPGPRPARHQPSGATRWRRARLPTWRAAGPGLGGLRWDRHGSFSWGKSGAWRVTALRCGWHGSFSSGKRGAWRVTAVPLASSATEGTRCACWGWRLNHPSTLKRTRRPLFMVK